MDEYIIREAVEDDLPNIQALSQELVVGKIRQIWRNRHLGDFWKFLYKI